MNKLKERATRLFIRFSGWTYSNMARLYMRLFVGIMFLQFGIRHWENFAQLSDTFPTVLGMTSQTTLICMIAIEIVCSTLIILGLLTRLSCLPPLVSMICADHYVVNHIMHNNIYVLNDTAPIYLPIMFIGIFIFIMIAGPGRVSLDYFISLRQLERQGKTEEEEMDEV